MGALERVCLLVVALSAEGLDRLGKQPLFRRHMRFVACQTIPRCGRMHGFLAHSRLHVFVAGKTHVGGLRQQQCAEFRLVGAVTLCAQAVLHGFMPAL